MSNPTDYVGRAIAPGDTIVYPVRRGSDMWLTSADVVTVTRSRSSWAIECITTTIAGRTQRVVLRHPSRCMVIDV